MLIDGQPYITLDHRPSDALCRNDGGHDLPNAAMVELATNDRLIETRLSIMFDLYILFSPQTMVLARILNFSYWIFPTDAYVRKVNAK